MSCFCSLVAGEGRQACTYFAPLMSIEGVITFVWDMSSPFDSRQEDGRMWRVFFKHILQS